MPNSTNLMAMLSFTKVHVLFWLIALLSRVRVANLLENGHMKSLPPTTMASAASRDSEPEVRIYYEQKSTATLQ